MSSSSRSEPRFGLDLSAPLPASWALIASLAVVHVATAMLLRRELGWVRALLYDRPLEGRVAVGGQSAEAVATGEVWRLVTSVLLHADALHLALNAAGLLALGRLLEPALGARRLLAWFVVGGVAGSLASHLVGMTHSDGASGGAYALLGAAIALGWRHRDVLPPPDRRLMGPVLWVFLAVNLVLSVAVPAIDVAGHLGGLAAGLVLGAGVGLRTGALHAVAEGLVLVVALTCTALAWVVRSAP